MYSVADLEAGRVDQAVDLVFLAVGDHRILMSGRRRGHLYRPLDVRAIERVEIFVGNEGRLQNWL